MKCQRAEVQLQVIQSVEPVRLIPKLEISMTVRPCSSHEAFPTYFEEWKLQKAQAGKYLTST